MPWTCLPVVKQSVGITPTLVDTERVYFSIGPNHRGPHDSGMRARVRPFSFKVTYVLRAESVGAAVAGAAWIAPATSPVAAAPTRIRSDR